MILHFKQKMVVYVIKTININYSFNFIYTKDIIILDLNTTLH